MTNDRQDDKRLRQIKVSLQVFRLWWIFSCCLCGFCVGSRARTLFIIAIVDGFTCTQRNKRNRGKDRFYPCVSTGASAAISPHMFALVVLCSTLLQLALPYVFWLHALHWMEITLNTHYTLFGK